MEISDVTNDLYTFANKVITKDLSYNERSILIAEIVKLLENLHKVSEEDTRSVFHRIEELYLDNHCFLHIRLANFKSDMGY